MSALKLVIILFVLQLSIFCAITFRPFTIAPPGHTYSQFSKNYFFPIFFYPNMILQAKDGPWSIKDTHSTEPQQRLYGHWFYIFAGKIASLTHIDQTVMFTLAQVAGAAALFAATYIFVTRLLPKSMHTLALLFALILELGPAPKFFGQIGTLSSWTPAINDYVLIFRHFDLPHHVWAEALAFISLFLVLFAYQKPTILRIIGIFVTTFLNIWFVPSIIITLWIVVYPLLLFWALATQTMKKVLLPMGAALAATLIACLQTKIAFAQAGGPWAGYWVEKIWVANITLVQQYLSSLLIYLPLLALFLFILPFRWKHWPTHFRLTVLLLAAWVASPFIGIPLSGFSFFPVANFRLINGPMYVAAGILSAVGLVEMLTFIPSMKTQKIILAIVTGVVIGFSLCVTSVYLHSFFTYQDQLDPHAYPATTTWEGMQFLRTVPRDSGIMVREPFGEMLPTFADIRVYIGGQHGYPDWLTRQAAAITFFSGTMSENEAQKFLKTNDIQYVFYGPDEQSVTTQSPLYPNVLKPVFKNATVTVFTLR